MWICTFLNIDHNFEQITYQNNLGFSREYWAKQFRRKIFYTMEWNACYSD